MDILGKVALIRLKEYQIKNWILENILTTSNLPYKRSKYSNLVTQIIKKTRDKGLTIDFSKGEKYFEYKEGKTSIREIINNNTHIYKRYNSSRKNQLYG